MPLLSWTAFSTAIMTGMANEQPTAVHCPNPVFAGVLVTAYVDGVTNPFTTTTSENGSFAFPMSSINMGKQVRVEFSGYPAYTYALPGSSAGGARFVLTPVSVVVGFSDPADYCQPLPNLVTPVYRAGTESREASALVSFSLTTSGQQGAGDNNFRQPAA